MGLFWTGDERTNPLARRQSLFLALALNVYAWGTLWRSYYIFLGHPVPEYIYSDMQAYVDMARRMLDPANTYTAGDCFHPPGTSMFIAFSFILDGTYKFVMYAQYVMSCLVPVLIALIGYELFGRAAALAALAISSVYWQFIDYASYCLSENPFMFFMLLSLWLLIRSLRMRSAYWAVPVALISGVALGTGATFKSVGLGASAFVGLYLVYLGIRYRWGRVPLVLASSLVGICLIVVPVSIRATRINDNRFTIISGNAQMNVLLGHYGDICSLHFHDSKRGAYYDFGTASICQQGNVSYRDVPWGPCDGAELLNLAIKWIKENPVDAFLLSCYHVFNLFSTPPWPTSATPERRWMRFAEQLYAIFILLPAAMHVTRNLRPLLTFRVSAAGDMVIVLPIAALFIVAFLTIGEPRYRIPFDSFMILLAARCYTGGVTREDGLAPPKARLLAAPAAAARPLAAEPCKA